MTGARGVALIVGATVALSCGASPSITIEPLPAKTIPDGAPITACNPDEALQRGNR